MFKPRLWLWRRIQEARKRVKQANAQLEALELDTVPSEGQKRLDVLGLREDELKLLLQQRLIGAAIRWRVFLPYNPESWMTPAYKKGRVLKPEVEHAIREQIFQRKVVLAVVFFGLCSLVQAIYAVLSYHRRH